MPHLDALETTLNVSDESCVKEEMRNGAWELASLYMEHRKLNLATE